MKALLQSNDELLFGSLYVFPLIVLFQWSYKANKFTKGHVGKSTTGLDFLIESDIIPYIANLAIKSTDLNIRG